MLISDQQPLRLADVEPSDLLRLPSGHPPMRSFLGVPLLIRGKAWGNLYLTEKADGEFDDADEEDDPRTRRRGCNRDRECAACISSSANAELL